MKINWKVRIKNPVFWTNIAATIILTILAHLGINWADITTWSAFGNVLLSAIKSPVILVAVIMSVWNAINDPTTAGLSDSKRALSYIKPKDE